MISGPWTWNKAREKAAVLLAEDRLSDERIAEDCGVSRVTLHFWKQREEFTNRIAEHVEAFREAIRAEGIANKQNRIDALADRQRRMQTVIEERAAAAMDVPGGSTGLLVKTPKLVKVYDAGASDDDGEILYSAKRDVLVYEYAVDTALLKEMRATEQQAAQEIGQWTEKRDVTSGGKPVQATTFTILIDRREDDEGADADSDG